MAKSEFERALSELTTLQKAFVYEYPACNFNGTEAAYRAGYKGDRDQLGVTASQNLGKPKIKRALELLLKERAMSADEVLSRIADQARADVGVFFKVVEEWTFYPLPLDDILDATEVVDPETGETRVSYLVRRVSIDPEKLTDPNYSHLLSKVSSTARGGLQIELYSKQNALQMLGKHYALFTDKIKTEDWRDEAIQAIRDGRLGYGPLRDELGPSLADELFALARVQIEDRAGHSEDDSDN